YHGISPLAILEIDHNPAEGSRAGVRGARGHDLSAPPRSRAPRPQCRSSQTTDMSPASGSSQTSGTARPMNSLQPAPRLTAHPGTSGAGIRAGAQQTRRNPPAPGASRPPGTTRPAKRSQPAPHDSTGLESDQAGIRAGARQIRAILQVIAAILIKRRVEEE